MKLTMEFSVDLGEVSDEVLADIKARFRDHAVALLHVADDHGDIQGWPMEPVEGEWNVVEGD